MVKLYTFFQDKKTIKNAFAIFAVLAFERIACKYGINCRDALLWLYIPPGVLFVVSIIKSKNILFLVNRKTSKEKCLTMEMIGHGVAAVLYLFLPSVVWMISAFLNTKIWVCYRAGFDECGETKKCSEQEKFAWKLLERDAKFESQIFGLLMLTGAIASLAAVTWLNHLLFARPLKERELNELVREATRSVLERYVVDRTKEKMNALGKEKVEIAETSVEVEAVPGLDSAPTYRDKKEDETLVGKKPKSHTSDSLADKKAKWLSKVDEKIDMYLDEFLVLNAVRMVYPEI